jgi:hypothetical protein
MKEINRSQVRVSCACLWARDLQREEGVQDGAVHEELAMLPLHI